MGVEVLLTSSNHFLSQHEYIQDLLDHTYMLGAKEVATPLSTTGSLSLHDGSPKIEAIEYKQVIHAL